MHLLSSLPINMALPNRQPLRAASEKPQQYAQIIHRNQPLIHMKFHSFDVRCQQTNYSGRISYRSTLAVRGFKKYTDCRRTQVRTLCRKGGGNVAGKKGSNSSSGRDKADRRAGPNQGPYVNNGKLPRSRNDDGTWRAKRSDAGKSRSK